MRQPLPSRCYYCKVWSDLTSFCDLCWHVGRPIRLWERCLWLINPFDHGLRLKTYRCLPYCSVQTSWKHGIAKREDCATHIRQTSSVQKQRRWRGCSDIVLVYHPKNQPGTQSTPENAAVDDITFHKYHVYTKT